MSQHLSCMRCHYLIPDANAHADCPQCNASLYTRKPLSLIKTMAYLVTSVALFIPANMLPTMTTTSLLGTEDNTILSGVIYLWIHGDALIASIVFIASFVTPLFKIISIGYLCISCQIRSTKYIKFRTQLYHINERIGRWSMIDVFVVALLGAMVQVGNLATIEPRAGIVAFACMIFSLMISLHQFDPRLIWDTIELQNNKPYTSYD